MAMPTAPPLTVREIRPGDIDGVARLYASLSPHDTYRRFFSPFVPPRETLEAWSSLAPPEGAGLVAEAALPDGTSELVGHADCHRLPNGNGELAITVAQRWRGGLGASLLDALLDHAAAIGIPNLEAELFVDNRPMHTLLRHRGAVTTARPDFVFERLMVSTDGGVPTWPRVAPHPRLLIEHPGWPAVGEVLADEGWTVVACVGPGGRNPCPALLGEPCPLAEGADVIATLLPDPSDVELESAHRRPHVAPVITGPSWSAVGMVEAVRRLAEPPEGRFKR